MSLVRSVLTKELKRSWRKAIVNNGSNFQSSMIDKRFFAVKELPWCAPKTSPNKTADVTSDPERTDINSQKNHREEEIPEPIDQFGIVAAMSKNRIIGLNGKIPWERCAEDRENFKNLTRDGIMIIGRHTYEEEPNQKHIDHTKWCIVVSKRLTEDSIKLARPIDTNIRVVHSFPAALGLAKELAGKHYVGTDDIVCWVAGGEPIYEEALRHRSAKEVHLTTMHLDINVDAAREKSLKENTPLSSALFPAKHHWDRFFKKISEIEGGGGENEENAGSPRFTYVTYTRTVPRSAGCCGL